MSWLMFLLYVVQANPSVTSYDAILAKHYYASAEECNAAGVALIEKLQKDEKVVKIVAGTCVPSEVQQVNK